MKKRTERFFLLIILAEILILSTLLFELTLINSKNDAYNKLGSEPEKSGVYSPWQRQTIYNDPGGQYYRGFKIDDIENDGYPEMIFLMDTYKMFIVNYSSGTYNKRDFSLSFLSTQSLLGLEVIDCDGDGIKEIYVFTGEDHGSHHEVQIWQGKKSGYHSWDWEKVNSFNDTHFSYRQHYAADCDNDGVLEIILCPNLDEAVTAKANLYYLEYNTSGNKFYNKTFDTFYLSDDISYSSCLTTGDINNDGLNEIYVQISNGSDGSGRPKDSYIFQYQYDSLSEDWEKTLVDEEHESEYAFCGNMVVGDADNDGMNELVYNAKRPSTLLFADFNGSHFVNHTTILSISNWWGGYSNIHVLDIDNDGLNEIVTGVVQECCATRIYIFNGSGDNWDNRLVWDGSEDNTAYLGISDLDTDGTLEIYHAAGYTAYRELFVYKQNGYPHLPSAPQFYDAPRRFNLEEERGTITIEWKPSFAKNLLNYHLQVSDSYDFDDLFIDNNQIPADQPWYHTSDFELNTTYWFRISAINGTGEGSFSTTQRFIVQSDWWNYNWEYRKEISVNYSQGSKDLNNYIKSFQIPYQNGMQKDFDDIRFVDSNNNELRYWIEEVNSEKNATAWIEVPEILSSNYTSIYIYYGNSFASSNSEFIFDFTHNSTLDYSISDDYWTTRNLWEKPGSNKMYVFGTPSGNPSSWYWSGSSWIRDDSAANGIPSHMAYEHRYHYYDEEWGEMLFYSKWTGGIYENHIKIWDGDSWETNSTLEAGLDLRNGSGGEYLKYILFTYQNQRHLLFDVNQTKYSWSGTQWVENSSVPAPDGMSGQYVHLHYRFTHNGEIQSHRFPILLEYNESSCRVWQLGENDWKVIYTGKLGNFPISDEHIPDTNVIDGRLTLSVRGSTPLWSSNLYFAENEPSYKFGDTETLQNENFNITWNNHESGNIITHQFIDINQDGKLEMIKPLPNYETAIYVLVGEEYEAYDNISIAVYEFGDYDGDGIDEFVGKPSSTYDYYFYNYSWQSKTLNQENIWVTGYNDNGDISFGDVDNDGKEEFMYADNGIAYGGREGYYRLISYNGLAFEEIQQFDDTGARGWDGLSDATLIDIDGDGYDEVACGWGYGSNRDGYVRIFDDATGGFSQLIQYDFERDPTFLNDFDEHEDLNGDGNDDLVIGISETSVGIYRYIITYNSSTSSFSYQKLTNQVQNRNYAYGVGQISPYDPYPRYISFYNRYGSIGECDRIRLYRWQGDSLGDPTEIILNKKYTDPLYDLRLNIRDINGDGIDEIIWEGYNIEGYQTTHFIFLKDADFIPPSWEQMPSDQTIELGDSFYYDINATDLAGIKSYNISGVTEFVIDSETGIITNSSSLSCGIYMMGISAYDPSDNAILRSIMILIEDTTSPIWIENPTNQWTRYGFNFSYNINASDLSGISSYWINDTTNFTIQANGLIQNATILDPGVYWVEIRVNDTYSNQISTIIKVSVYTHGTPRSLLAGTSQFLSKPIDGSDFEVEYSFNLSEDTLVIYYSSLLNPFEYELSQGLLFTEILMNNSDNLIELNITIEYLGSNNLEDLQGWWFNESSNQWEQITIEVLGNTILFSVDHASIFAMSGIETKDEKNDKSGEEEGDDTPGEGEGPIIIIIIIIIIGSVLTFSSAGYYSISKKKISKKSGESTKEKELEDKSISSSSKEEVQRKRRRLMDSEMPVTSDEISDESPQPTSIASEPSFAGMENLPDDVKTRITVPKPKKVQKYKVQKASAKNKTKSVSKEMDEKEREELKKTESEVDFEDNRVKCIVHRGPIYGNIYLCKSCQTFYCDRCAKVLKMNGEKCWTCNAEIDVEINEKDQSDFDDSDTQSLLDAILNEEPAISEYLNTDKSYDQIPDLKDVLMTILSEDAVKKLNLIQMKRAEKKQLIKEILVLSPSQRNELLSELLESEQN